MDKEQRIAYINAQVVCALAEIEGMKAFWKEFMRPFRKLRGDGITVSAFLLAHLDRCKTFDPHKKTVRVFPLPV